MEVIPFLNEEECNSIIYEIEKNSLNLLIGNSFGSYKHAAKEIDIKDLSNSIVKNKIIIKSSELSKKIKSKVNTINFVKYEPDNVNHMKLHYDWSKYTLIVNLNNNYEGGYTGFPLKDYYFNVSEHGIGKGILFNSMNFMSYHCGMKTKKNNRYVLVITFKNNKNFILRYLWKLPYLFFRDILFGSIILDFYFHKIKKFKY